MKDRFKNNPKILEHLRKNAKLFGFKKGHGKIVNNKGSTGKHWKKTPEQIERSRLANLGAKNPSWKGGISPMRKIISGTPEYKLWRKAVFERDNWTCIWCGNKKQIQADHIKSFAQFPELRFAIDNGRTLCLPCHKTTDTYAGKSNKKNYQSGLRQA